MKKSLAYAVAAGVLVAPLSFTSPAAAGGCGAIIAPVRPATCIYQGDYMVQQWASYDGPALIAPQDTYAPSPTVGVYVHGAYPDEPAVAVERDVVLRRSAHGVRPARKGKVEVVKARAEVRIYSPQRMDIRLYRQ